MKNCNHIERLDEHAHRTPTWCCAQGGGFHAFWYCLGFLKYKREYDHEFTINRIGGWSAGAMAAALIVSVDTQDEKKDLFQCLRETLNAAHYTRYTSEIKLGRLDAVVRCFMNKILPKNAHINASGNLQIVICDPVDNFKGKMINTWSSRRAMIDCIVASTYIPFLVGNDFCDPVYGCIDGGFAVDREELYCNALVVVSPRTGPIEMLKEIDENTAYDFFWYGVDDALNTRNRESPFI